MGRSPTRRAAVICFRITAALGCTDGVEPSMAWAQPSSTTLACTDTHSVQQPRAVRAHFRLFPLFLHSIVFRSHDAAHHSLVHKRGEAGTRVHRRDLCECVHCAQAATQHILVAVHLLLHRVTLKPHRQRLLQRLHQLVQRHEHRVRRHRRELAQHGVARELHVVVVLQTALQVLQENAELDARYALVQNHIHALKRCLA
mmetsp:Transcript_38833/g.69524  ORF Transcript_38833/g.69524 Transcript_38833/m.69524 type:complete len:200 (+) Transcript_38833:479-1078(+)